MNSRTGFEQPCWNMLMRYNLIIWLIKVPTEFGHLTRYPIGHINLVISAESRCRTVNNQSSELLSRFHYLARLGHSNFCVAFNNKKWARWGHKVAKLLDQPFTEKAGGPRAAYWQIECNIISVFGGNKTLDQRLGANSKTLYFCSILLQICYFFQLYSTKKAENDYFDQRLAWAATNAGRNIQQTSICILFTNKFGVLDSALRLGLIWIILTNVLFWYEFFLKSQKNYPHFLYLRQENSHTKIDRNCYLFLWMYFRWKGWNLNCFRISASLPGFRVTLVLLGEPTGVPRS